MLRAKGLKFAALSWPLKAYQGKLWAMRKPEIGQFDSDHLRLMTKGVELYNKRHFWECHEELEHHWLEARGENARYIFWAVIQVAAALVHFETKNLIGVQGMLKKARDKIRRARESHVESDILHYNLNWTTFCELVESSPVAGSLADYEKLANFRFPAPEEWRYS